MYINLGQKLYDIIILWPGMILNTKSTNYKEGIRISKREMSPNTQKSKLNKSKKNRRVYFFKNSKLEWPFTDVFIPVDFTRACLIKYIMKIKIVKFSSTLLKYFTLYFLNTAWVVYVMCWWITEKNTGRTKRYRIFCLWE